MVFSAGKGRGDEGKASGVSGRELSPEERVRQVQEQMQKYVELVQKKASPEEIQKAERNLQKEMGNDRFEAFKRHVPAQLRVQRSLDAQTIYRHFRLPGRERIVHDHRGEGRAEHLGVPKEAQQRAEGMRVRDGKLVKEAVRKYVNYLGDRMRERQEIREPGARKQLDELLSKFERMIIKRFENDQQVGKQLADAKPKFLPKTEKQWKDFFQAFSGREIKKSVPIKNIMEFVFRGLLPKGERGLLISDMVLKSGRIEKFIRVGILADAMAKLNRLIPGDKFGKEFLDSEMLYYLALAVAQGREYEAAPKPTQGLFMGGVAEEKAAQDLGLPLAAHLEKKTKELKGGKKTKGFGAFGWDKDKEVMEEIPYQFIPWWHWGNLKRPGKFKMTTVAFYIALFVLSVIGIVAVTAKLLK